MATESVPKAAEWWERTEDGTAWMAGWAAIQRFTLRSQEALNGVGAARGAAVSILLVEDDAAHAELVRTALEEHGLEGELIVASDGEGAISYIGELKGGTEAGPALAIVDLNLPRRSGLEVLQALRGSTVCERMPVAVLSSSDARQDREDAARLGANLYLCKPSQLDEFLDLGRIFTHLAERSQQG